MENTEFTKNLNRIQQIDPVHYEKLMEGIKGMPGDTIAEQFYNFAEIYVDKGLAEGFKEKAIENSFWFYYSNNDHENYKKLEDVFEQIKNDDSDLYAAIAERILEPDILADWLMCHPKTCDYVKNVFGGWERLYRTCRIFKREEEENKNKSSDYKKDRPTRDPDSFSPNEERGFEYILNSLHDGWYNDIREKIKLNKIDDKDENYRLYHKMKFQAWRTCMRDFNLKNNPLQSLEDLEDLVKNKEQESESLKNQEQESEDSEDLIKKIKSNDNEKEAYKEQLDLFKKYVNFQQEVEEKGYINDNFVHPRTGDLGTLPSFHQIVAMYHNLEDMRYGVFDGCGTGKTAIAALMKPLILEKKISTKIEEVYGFKKNSKSKDYEENQVLTSLMLNFNFDKDKFSETIKKLQKKGMIDADLQISPDVYDKIKYETNKDGTKKETFYDRTLVVGPKLSIKAWQDGLEGEKKRYFKEKQAVTYIDVDRNSLTKEKLEDSDFIFVNFEQLNCDFKINGETKKVYEILLDLGYDNIIVDEVQYIKNLESTCDSGKDSFAACTRFLTNNEENLHDMYVTLLSGTPMPDNLNDYANILFMLQPEIFVQENVLENGDVEHFINFEKIGEIFKDKYKASPRVLSNLIRKKTIRRKSEDVTELEELIRHGLIPDEYLELTENQQKIFKYIIGERKFSINDNNNKLIQARRSLLDPRLVKPEILKELDLFGKITRKDSAKYQRLEEILSDHLSKNEKVVIFSSELREGVTRSDSIIVKNDYLLCGINEEYKLKDLTELQEKIITKIYLENEPKKSSEDDENKVWEKKIALKKLFNLPKLKNKKKKQEKVIKSIASLEEKGIISSRGDTIYLNLDSQNSIDSHYQAFKDLKLKSLQDELEEILNEELGRKVKFQTLDGITGENDRLNYVNSLKKDFEVPLEKLFSLSKKKNQVDKIKEINGAIKSLRNKLDEKEIIFTKKDVVCLKLNFNLDENIKSNKFTKLEQEIIKKVYHGGIENRIDGIVCTTKAGGVSIDFSAATAGVFLDQDYSPATTEQAEMRIHRQGHEGDSFIYYLFGKDSLDIDVHNLIKQKKEYIEMALDGALLSVKEEELLADSEKVQTLCNSYFKRQGGVSQDYSELREIIINLRSGHGKLIESKNSRMDRSLYDKHKITGNKIMKEDIYETTVAQEIAEWIGRDPQGCWHDKEFCEKYFNDFNTLAPHILAAAKVCDILDKSDVRDRSKKSGKEDVRSIITFPRTLLADCAGHGILYSAFQDLEKLVTRQGFSLPVIVDRDFSPHMNERSPNPNKYFADICDPMKTAEILEQFGHFDFVDNSSLTLLENRERIRDYVLEVNRLLRPGGFFQIGVGARMLSEKFYQAMEEEAGFVSLFKNKKSNYMMRYDLNSEIIKILRRDGKISPLVANSIINKLRYTNYHIFKKDKDVDKVAKSHFLILNKGSSEDTTDLESLFNDPYKEQQISVKNEDKYLENKVDEDPIIVKDEDDKDLIDKKVDDGYLVIKNENGEIIAEGESIKVEGNQITIRKLVNKPEVAECEPINDNKENETITHNPGNKEYTGKYKGRFFTDPRTGILTLIKF